MDYLALKTVHQAAVALSLAGFFARGLASLLGAAWVRGRLARTLPHIVDSVLLVSALLLAWRLQLTPGAAPWLMAKIAGLLVYIGLGVVALRPGRPAAVRAAAWVTALATFGWIVSVAITKNPLGVLAFV
ncbi:Invasion gene expression up-regulator, SirB [Polaromonas sp. JS666]|nr:Invasion gene expression up-regulator, SirB [Polaromonas sp. JS666]